jgi:hypothetical protein
MISPPDLSRLTEAEKDALILALWTQVQVLTARAWRSWRPGCRSRRRPRATPACRRRKGTRRTGRGRTSRRGRAKAASGARVAVARWPRNPTSSSSPKRQPAPPAGRRSARATRCCTRATTRSPCRRAGPPGGHQGRALCRPLPVLRRHDLGAGAGRHGGGRAVRPVGPGAGALPALHPRHQRPAADPAVLAPVRVGDQRGRLGRPVPAGQAALRR